MKKTIKRVLSLAFVAIMIMSLAVPAFAAENDTIEVEVRFSDENGLNDSTIVKIRKNSANLKRVLLNSESELGLDFYIYSKTGTLRKVAIVDDAKEIENGSIEPYGTDKWYVAVNGKIVDGVLESYTLEDKDVITVFWGDSTLDTKLVQVDGSNIIKGIISFYYYDAEGNKVPVTGAKVELVDKDGNPIMNKLETIEETDFAGGSAGERYLEYHTTDERGQVWVTPEHLDHENVIKIVSFDVDDVTYDVHKKDDEYDAEAAKFYEMYGDHNIARVNVVDQTVEINGEMYNVAGATGDYTFIYIILMAAAVATLGTVLVIKSNKKSSTNA